MAYYMGDIPRGFSRVVYLRIFHEASRVEYPFPYSMSYHTISVCIPWYWGSNSSLSRFFFKNGSGATKVILYLRYTTARHRQFAAGTFNLRWPFFDIEAGIDSIDSSMFFVCRKFKVVLEKTSFEKRKLQYGRYSIDRTILVRKRENSTMVYIYIYIYIYVCV